MDSGFERKPWCSKTIHRMLNKMPVSFKTVIGRRVVVSAFNLAQGDPELRPAEMGELKKFLRERPINKTKPGEQFVLSQTEFPCAIIKCKSGGFMIGDDSEGSASILYATCNSDVDEVFIANDPRLRNGPRSLKPRLKSRKPK